MHQLQLNFWLLAAVCQVCVGALMVKRRFHARYPVFFSYTLFHVVRSLLLFALFRLLQQNTVTYFSYFVTYWALDAISVGFGFLLVYRITYDYFKNYVLAQRIVAASSAMGLIALLILNSVLVLTLPGDESHHLISTILLLGRSAAIIQTGLVLVLYVCSRLMALPWRTDFSFGIALGLSICSSVELVATFSRSYFGAVVNDFYSLAKILAYFLAVIVWVVYIFYPREVAEIRTEAMPVTADVDNWNRVLKEVVTQ